MYKLLKLLFVLILPVVLILAGCGGMSKNEEAKPSEGKLTLTEAEFPRIDGSTATIPLGEAAAAVLMGISRSDAARFADFTGTDSSFGALLEGRADLLIVYEPAAESRRNMPAINSLNMQPIGSDALVFIVNAANPVNNLSVEQVRDIYAGIITNWSEVGGPNEPIAAFQRNVTAGSHTLLMSLLMYDTPLMVPPQHFVYAGMGGMVGAVAQFDGGEFGIGYNVFYYVTEMVKDPNVKVLSINGVAPTQQTIGSGEYPLTNYFYAVIRPNEPHDSPAHQVFNWLQSPEGQALIHLEGYASINPPF